MAFNTQNMDLGSVQVFWTPNGGAEIDLGGTLDNAKAVFKFSKADIKADQFGVSPIDKRVTGLEITIETALTEVRDLSKWKVAFPHANLITSGLQTAVRFLPTVGQSDQAYAGKLRLHPLDKAAGDLSFDFTAFKAVATEESEIVHGPGEQKKLKIVWRAYPDMTQTGYPYYLIGDPSIGIVHAAIGSITFTGTGNGVISNASAADGVAATETVTATCVTPQTNAGIFEVHGSVTGPMGLATVGVQFTAFGGQISFKINDGTTDFVLGDAFTIPVTSSNFV